MLKQDVVGWSHQFIKKKCPKCGADNKIMFVQTQKRIKLGPVKLINLGQRDFGRECYNCGDRTDPTPGDLKTAKTVEYYFRRDIKRQGSLTNDKTANKKYPILTEKTRELIVKDNRKEGLVSGAIVTVIAIILSGFFSWWYWVFIVGWLGALYGIFEDPEMKHRAYIEKNGKMFDGTKTSLSRKDRSKRSLK